MRLVSRMLKVAGLEARDASARTAAAPFLAAGARAAPEAPPETPDDAKRARARMRASGQPGTQPARFGVPPRPAARFGTPQPGLHRVGAQAGAIPGGRGVAVAVAKAALSALGLLPRTARAELEHVIGQVEEMERLFVLPRLVAGAAGELLGILRGRLRDLPAASGAPASGPQRFPIDAATARAILQAIAEAPCRTRPELDLMSGQLASFLQHHELAPDLRARGQALLGRMEQGMGRLPMTREEASQATLLDGLVFAAPRSGASGSKPGPAPAELLERARILAGQPVLHPQLRAAALRAEAFLRTGADGSVHSVWNRPMLWSFPHPAVEQAILHQSSHALTQLSLGHAPTVALVGQMFGNDPARLRTFAAELAQRTQGMPSWSHLHRLASHIRDTATTVPGRPGIVVPPMPQGPGGQRFRSPAEMEDWRRRFARSAYLSGVKL